MIQARASSPHHMHSEESAGLQVSGYFWAAHTDFFVCSSAYTSPRRSTACPGATSSSHSCVCLRTHGSDAQSSGSWLAGRSYFLWIPEPRWKQPRRPEGNSAEARRHFHTQRPQKNIGADTPSGWTRRTSRKPVSAFHIVKRLTGEAGRLKYIFVLFALRLRGSGLVQWNV